MGRKWMGLVGLSLCFLLAAGCAGEEADNWTEAPAGSTPSAQQVQDTPPEDGSRLQDLVGASLEEVYATLGQPDSSAYQDSCAVPDAQDGFLYYDGFTVVTLKTADGETVQYIE